MAEYFLIIMLMTGQGAAISSTPMQTLQACEKAAAQAKTLVGGFSTVKTTCIKADE